jgi:GNAT superfamily N-acetyltransferase
MASTLRELLNGGSKEMSKARSVCDNGSMSKLNLRAATPTDVPEILALIRELAEYEKLSHQVVATEALLHQHLFDPKPAAEVMMGESDGQLAGFALFFTNFSTFLGRPGIYLEDLFVRPRFRGIGLGKALLQAVARLAVERNCGRFEWAVLDWNQSAIDFYLSQGATLMNDWRICRVTGDALERLGQIR